ncbi:MAG: YgjV family protein [Pseudomonadota bacterium]
MDILQALFFDNYGANAIGYIAIGLAIVCYVSKNQTVFIVTRSAADFGFALHFILLGAYLAGYLSAILAAIFVLKLLTPSVKIHTGITIAALIASVALSYSGLHSFADAVAIFGTITCFVTVLIKSNFYMRLWAVCMVSPTWFIYAMMISSAPSMIANAIYMISGGYGLMRVMLAAEETGEVLPRPFRTLAHRGRALAHIHASVGTRANK